MERSIAAQDHVGLIDTTRWTCPGDPCPAIIGNVLLWRDQNHLTSVMTTALSGLLRTQIMGLAAHRAAPQPKTAYADAVRTQTAAIPVPRHLRPSINHATSDTPILYHDGCHLRMPQTKPLPCVFGRRRGKIRIALIGDSHAAQWFPALNRIAHRRRYRLVSLTHSACSAPVVNVYGKTTAICNAWRVNAVRRIKREHPDIVVVTSLWHMGIADSSGREITDPAERARVWRAGYDALFRQLHARARHIVLLTDSGMSTDVPLCLAKHLSDARPCFTPRSVAVNPGNAAAERATASADGATLVDTTRWSCPGNMCAPFIGHTLLWRNQDHLTARFTASMAPKLDAALQAVLGRR
jgi:hypothetical protein